MVRRRSVLAAAGIALTAGCSVLDSSPSVTLPDSDWTESGGQYNRGTVPAEDGLDGLEEVGSVDVGSGPFSAPIVIDDVAYVPNRDELVAVSIDDVEEIKSFDITAFGSPISVDGDLVVPEYDRFESPLEGTLRRIGTEGETIWEVELDGGLPLSPTVSPDGIAIRTKSAVCFVSLDGELLWVEDAPEFAALSAASQASPVIVDDRVFAAGISDIRCYDLESGEQLWQVPDLVQPRLAYADGTLYTSPNLQGLIALDPASGEKLWQYDVVGRQGAQHTPAIGEDLIYTTTGYDAVAIDRDDGDVEWRYGEGSFGDGLVGVTVADPVLVGDAVVISSTGQTLTVLSKEDGAERESIRGAGTYYAPVVASESLLVVEAEGGINRPGTLRVFQPA